MFTHAPIFLNRNTPHPIPSSVLNGSCPLTGLSGSPLFPSGFFSILLPVICLNGEGNGNPLQYSCLENPMDRGAWQATIHRLQRVRHDCATNTHTHLSSVQFSSVAQLCPTLCNSMNHGMPGLPVHHQLLEFAQTYIHRVGDAIQPSHPLSSPFPPAPNPSQHQGLFQ